MTTAHNFDFICAYESGELESEDDLFAGFQGLIDSGLVWQLQGSYGRTAVDLINNGYCQPALVPGTQRIPPNDQ